MVRKRIEEQTYWRCRDMVILNLGRLMTDSLNLVISHHRPGDLCDPRSCVNIRVQRKVLEVMRDNKRHSRLRVPLL